VKESVLLTVDGAFNMLLGALLMAFPAGLASFLGVPTPGSPLYVTVLGGVLGGIGLALIVQQLLDRPIGSRGIEIPIIINFVGAGTLIGVLVAGHLAIPLHGHIFLWIVAIITLILGVAEVVLHLREAPQRRQRSGGRLQTGGQESTPAG
jgi:hypothetical protein